MSSIYRHHQWPWQDAWWDMCRWWQGARCYWCAFWLISGSLLTTTVSQKQQQLKQQQRDIFCSRPLCPFLRVAFPNCVLYYYPLLILNHCKSPSPFDIITTRLPTLPPRLRPLPFWAKLHPIVDTELSPPLPPSVVCNHDRDVRFCFYSLAIY